MRSLLLGIVILLSACSNMQSIENSASSTQSNQQTNLMAVFHHYEGTPYRYGGQDKSGFDCSGFIGVAYQEAYRLKLPRTTEQIARSGKPVRRDQLKLGDIVFFQTSVKQLHAGIYINDGQFIHASTSKGVIKSSMENRYWQQRYLKARRFL